MAQKTDLLSRLLRFLFRILTILSVDLVITLLNSLVLKLDEAWDKPVVTVVGMLFVVVLFYFLIEYIDRWTALVLKLTVGAGNLIRFRKTAIILIMAALFYGQYLCYHRLWFGKWPALPWRL